MTGISVDQCNRKALYLDARKGDDVGRANVAAFCSNLLVASQLVKLK